VRNSSLDRLVIDHLPAALRFATRLTGGADSAEELVQEALLRVVRGWTAFRGESAFRTWLFRILINVFRDRLKASRGGMFSIDEGDALPPAGSNSEPPQVAMADELRELIAREISHLPPRQREVLVLTVLEGLSTREVAGIVGISQGNDSFDAVGRAVSLEGAIVRLSGQSGKVIHGIQPES